MSSKILRALALSMALLTAAALSNDRGTPLAGALSRISGKKFLKDVKALSSDEMKGRGNDSPQLLKAAEYVRERFDRAGLKPAPGTHAYFQFFEITTGADVGETNLFEVTLDGQANSLKIRDDYWPIGFADGKEIGGGLVFAGYGITADKFHYDDYAELDVTGKVVLVLDHEPQEKNPNSVFAGTELTGYASSIEKATNAKMRGALALVVVPDLDAHPDGQPDQAFLEPEGLGIPVVRVRQHRAAHWFTAAGRNIVQLQRRLDETLQPQSFVFAGGAARIDLDITPKKRRVQNLIGWIQGADPLLKDEFVLLGAHYDHIGLGFKHSMSPQLAGQVHNGADDNASGTAALIQLARAFDPVRPQLKRSIIFSAFAGEELGLLGSSHYVRNPPFPLDKTVAMLNLDMVGRAERGVLSIGGTSSAAEWEQLLPELVADSQLKVKFSGADYGSSDHVAFDLARIPSLFFFSGLHGDYHKASDDWEKIDPANSEKIIRLAFRTAYEVQGRSQRLAYVQRPTPQRSVSGASGRGYGPDFGSVPDFSQDLPGVRFADVRPGRPAAKAGLKAGDRLISFAGKKIENLYDFTHVLRQHKPGDEVEVEVVRDGATLKVKVVLGERK